MVNETTAVVNFSRDVGLISPSKFALGATEVDPNGYIIEREYLLSFDIILC